VTLPNCLRKFSQTKHLAFGGRELRYLKLLAGRQAQRLRIQEISKIIAQRVQDSQPQCSSGNLPPEAHLGKQRAILASLVGKPQKCPEVSNAEKSCHHSYTD
jgi:hypothetical protein